MFTDKIKSVVGSRKFQTVAGQVGIAVISIIASNLISTTLNNGLEKLMDKVHGPVIEEVIAAVNEQIG